MEVEGVEGLRFKATLARSKLHSRKNFSDASYQRGFENLTPGRVVRDLTNRTFGVNDPLNHEIAFDPWMSAQRFLVTSAGLIAMSNHDRADVSRTATGIVSVGPEPPAIGVGLGGRLHRYLNRSAIAVDTGGSGCIRRGCGGRGLTSATSRKNERQKKPEVRRGSHAPHASSIRGSSQPWVALHERPSRLACGLEKRLPLFELPATAQENLGRHGPPRPKWTSGQPHIGLLRGLPTLAKIARATCRDEILPRIVPAAGTRDDVVDVQLTQRWTLSTVLTLMGITEHQIATSESHRDPRGSIVSEQVNDARHAELAPYDGNYVILIPHRQLAPELEVVRFADVVKSKRHTTVEENDSALHRRDLNGHEVSIKGQDWKR